MDVCDGGHWVDVMKKVRKRLLMERATWLPGWIATIYDLGATTGARLAFV